MKMKFRCLTFMTVRGRWVIYDKHFLILNLVFCPGFSVDKVPQNLDAIVIGSGIGGLTVAATLAKVGKKVLVLEQHDQSGGCCHTYVDKGFEFDVGKTEVLFICICIY